MIREVEDIDIDADLPLIAGRLAQYVTDPHGWLVTREGTVRATRGRLQVVLDADYPYIYDEDDPPYESGGVPQSAAEARALADLYEQAEDILAAFKSGEYIPPAPLPRYIDRKPRSGWGMFHLAAMQRALNNTTLLDMFDSLMPYTRQERFENVWRRIRGQEPIPRRPKTGGDGTGRYMKIDVGDGLGGGPS